MHVWRPSGHSRLGTEPNYPVAAGGPGAETGIHAG